MQKKQTNPSNKERKKACRNNTENNWKAKLVHENTVAAVSSHILVKIWHTNGYKDIKGETWGLLIAVEGQNLPARNYHANVKNL